MEESTIIVGLSAGKFEDMVSGAVLTGLRVYHNGKENAQNPGPEEVLTSVETAELLGITLPTLREYTRRGLVEGYRIGTRVRYKRSEVVGSLQRMRNPKTQRP